MPTFNPLTKAVAISTLVMGSLAAAAISADQGRRDDLAASREIAGSKAETTVRTTQTTSAQSSASASSSASTSSSVSVSAGASASSRATAGVGQGAMPGDCAADATATTEVDGKRVTVRKSQRSADGQGPCSADAHVDLRSDGSGQDGD